MGWPADLPRLAPVRTVAPAETPVSLDDLKMRLGIEPDDHDDDAALERMIAAAVAYLDGRGGVLGLAMVTQTWRTWAPGFPGGDWLALQVRPAQSVTVATRQPDGSYAAVSADVYELIAGTDALRLKPGQAWPATECAADAVRIDIVAGYGAAAAVPPEFAELVLDLAAGAYTDKESGSMRSFVDSPRAGGVRDAIAMHRRQWF